MSQTPDPQVSRTLAAVMARISMPTLLFAAVFALVMVLSWMFLLPRLTHIPLRGQTVSLDALIPYEQQLRSDIEQLERKRTSLVVPVQDGVYEALKKHSQCYPLVQDLQRMVEMTALHTAPGAVFVRGLRFASDGTLTLSGEVRNVGPRSMTVLAQFVKDMGALPEVHATVPPTFRREQLPDGSFRSPFEFSVRLQPCDA